MSNITLKGKLIITGKIETKTGLHIGGTAETLKIGGSDNPVIRDKNGKVFIPGSSLKGKIRSLLEIKDGKYVTTNKDEAQPCNCGKTDCHICMLFGPHKSDNIKEPPRVILRDAYLKLDDGKTIYDYLETKPENVIDRLKGTAQPRFIERVVAGTEFEYEVIFNIYKDKDKELIKKFIEGMKLLEDDYLGGSGSRGYGKIKFKEMSAKYRPKKYYEGAADEIELTSETNDLDNLMNSINF